METEANNNNKMSVASDANVKEVSNVSSLCDQVEKFSFNSSDSSGDYGISSGERNERRNDLFPETDAEAAVITNLSHTSYDSNLFSPIFIPDDKGNERLSKSLPVHNSEHENINPAALKTLFDFVLDACKKLHVLYSELDRKVSDNSRFLNEKMSTMHFLHQHDISQVVQQHRVDINKLSESLTPHLGEPSSDASVAHSKQMKEWSNQMEKRSDQMNLLHTNLPHNSLSEESSESGDLDDVDDNNNGDELARDAEIMALHETIENLQTIVQDLDVRVIECEQYPRRNNIVISGIPDEIHHEDLKSQVLDILDAVGLELNNYDISACHRLPKGRSRWPAKTIVRFINREHVDFCLKNRDRLTQRGTRNKLGGLNLRFYENLCNANNDVLRMAKWLLDKGHIHRYFIRNGFVKIVTCEGDDPEKVKHPQILRDRFPLLPVNLRD